MTQVLQTTTRAISEATASPTPRPAASGSSPGLGPRGGRAEHGGHEPGEAEHRPERVADLG